MEKVFIVLDGSGTDKNLDWPHALISAVLLFDRKRRKFRLRRSFHPNVREVFLDSGGFSFFRKYAEYPFTHEEYVEFIHKLNPDYVAVMDYPCEPKTNRDAHKTNLDRIETTIDNAIKLFDLGEDINWVMVVQGYTPEEYLYSLDRIKEQGLLTPVVAVGSICARKSVRSILEVLRPIRDSLPRRVKIHGFGVDLRALRNSEVFDILYSTDTGAWKFCKEIPGRFPRNQREKLICFESWKKRVGEILRENRNQTETI